MAKRRTSCLFFVWVCLLVSSVSITEAKKKNEEKTATVDSVEVSTNYGPMIFKNVSVGKSLMGSQIAGTVTNSTQRAWRAAYFKVSLYDKNGRPLNDASVSELCIKDFSKGDTRPLTDIVGKSPAEILWYNAFGRSDVATFKIFFDQNSFIDAHYVIALVKPRENRDLSFEDEFVRLVFSVSEKQIGFAIQNKTATAITIDWNQLAYIDPSGGSHKVIHQGVKYASSGEMMAPTVVPPTANVSDLIYPADYVTWDDVLHDWVKKSILAERDQEKHIGESFSAFMPLQINEGKKEYLFTFKIIDVSF
jgi:hypothetical protein